MRTTDFYFPAQNKNQSYISVFAGLLKMLVCVYFYSLNEHLCNLVL